jgi:WD40 repeat protein
VKGWSGAAVSGWACLLCVSLNAATPRVPVAALAFSPDGSRLLVGRHLAVQVFDVAALKSATSLACAFPKISSFAFANSGQFLLVAGGTPGAGGGAQLFEWPSGRFVQSLTNRVDMATAVVVSPAGNVVALAGADHRVELLKLDATGGKLSLVDTLTDHSRPVLAAAFSPDGQRLVTASVDRSIKVWDAASGKLQRSFSHHTDVVHCLSFRPRTVVDGQAVPLYCATGSDDKTVRVWQPEIGRMVRIVRGHEGPVFAVAYSRDGSLLYSAGKEGVIRVIDGDSDEILHHWTAHEDWIYSLALSPDGGTLASGDWTGRVSLWNVNGSQAKHAAKLAELRVLEPKVQKPAAPADAKASRKGNKQ